MKKKQTGDSFCSNSVLRKVHLTSCESTLRKYLERHLPLLPAEGWRQDAGSELLFEHSVNKTEEISPLIFICIWKYVTDSWFLSAEDSEKMSG